MFTQRIRMFLLPAASTLLLFACAASPTASSDTGEQSSAIETLGPSCGDQCAAAGATCTVDCRVSAQDCADATAICFDSCDRGVGPWLPC